jgi:hypothetical protein
VICFIVNRGNGGDVMSVKNYLVALMLSVMILTLILIPISGSQTTPQYDPWFDLNDDGVIDILDVVTVTSIYGSKGTPINKTALLLELLSKIDNLEERVEMLEANYSVTNLKLAPYAIPFNSTYRHYPVLTESGQLEALEGMSLTITLNRTSHLLILFSTEAKQENEGNYRISIGALVRNSTWSAYAYGPTYLTPYIYDPPWYDNQIMDFMTYTCHFYMPLLSAGKYEIEIRWCVTSGGKAYAWERVLTVIALPA